MTLQPVNKKSRPWKAAFFMMRELDQSFIPRLLLLSLYFL